MKALVVIPVLNRPHHVRPLLESIQTSEQKIKLEPLFVVSRSDRGEWQELRRARAPHLIVDWDPGSGDFAMKTNFAISQTDTEWILSGADDLIFHPGWADEAVQASERSGKRFVATNDRANPLVMSGKHATHPLVHRSYVKELGTIDEPGKLYHENYGHQCVDNEAVATAMYRDEFVFAAMSVVEHNHPIYPRGNIRAPMDDTYRKGMATGKEDIALLRSREHLWHASGRRRR